MKYKCPNNCEITVDTPFYYPPCCLPYACDEKHEHILACQHELGVLVYPDLSISNRWIDGIAGVSDDVKGYLKDHDCMPECVECGEEVG